MPEPRPRAPEPALDQEIGRRAARRRRAQREGRQAVWFSLGMMGLVGWSVVIPTLIGVALGWWIDSRWRGRLSWTLTLMFVGVAIGCLNAWYWVRQESERR